MLNIQLSPEVKKNLTIFATLFGIIVGITTILVTVTLLARSSWKTTLAKDVQIVLDGYSAGEYSVGEYLETDSNIATSSAVYSLIKKDNRRNEKYYGVIVRIPSILGPVPAVFICRENEDVVFAGYALDTGKAQNTIKLALSNSVMRYWENMIPKILEKTEK